MNLNQLRKILNELDEKSLDRVIIANESYFKEYLYEFIEHINLNDSL